MTIDVVIVAAARTPVGKFQGGLSTLTAPKLGAIAIKEAIARAEVPADKIDECIMGCVLAAGVGQNPARQAAIGAGIAPSVPAFTINKVCGSGLKAIMLAAQAIRAGDARCVVAGGMESMSNAPYLMPGARTGLKFGHGQIVDSMINDGLWDIYNDFHMGTTAELVAAEYKIARAEQDAFAAESHRRAVAAQQAGHFNEEIVPVAIPQRKGDPVVIWTDEGPRSDSTADKLAKLPPVFDTKPAGGAAGTVTAGNASALNDGAAAAVVMDAALAKELGLKPLATITGYASAGVEPKWVMMAPVKAVQAWAKKTGKDPKAMDQAELNEAFSVQAIACTRDLSMDPSKVNPCGGAVAIGHPIGASGARILTTLLYSLKRRGGGEGLASLCIGGGNAVAMSVKM